MRAIGWYIDQYRQAQVSINLIDYNVTPLHLVFETVREEAGSWAARDRSRAGRPHAAAPLVDAGRFYLRRQGKSPGVPEPELVEMAVRSLGLDQLAAFDAAKKVIEYQFQARRRWSRWSWTGSWTRCRPTRPLLAAAPSRRLRAASRRRSPRWWRTSPSARRGTRRRGASCPSSPCGRRR